MEGKNVNWEMYVLGAHEMKIKLRERGEFERNTSLDDL